jgi:hypothetical protein
MDKTLREEIRKQAGRSCLKYIETRFNRRLLTISREAIAEIPEEELLESWLSMPTVVRFIKYQEQIKRSNDYI